ncbi:MAG: HAD family hydrolase [Spirochaetaceae bacterium]|nr:MAG: HAD family hydrolase [Spirochaetaceae bacterium]
MLRALFFDMDGVIVDTERDGHRVAFNQTFQHFGIPDRWDEDLYHDLLQIAGGKERMKHYFTTMAETPPVPRADIDRLVAEMHTYKTSRLIDILEKAQLPLRPGVQRFMREANQAGLAMAICTTSNERAAHAVAATMLADIEFAAILAGDVVSRKKPDPEIYLLALHKTGCSAAECLVVEDSRNGVVAAKAAGIPVIATTNHYTEREDLSQSDLIVSCLGDSNGERAVVRKPRGGFAVDGIVHLEEVKRYLYDR